MSSSLAVLQTADILLHDFYNSGSLALRDEIFNMAKNNGNLPDTAESLEALLQTIKALEAGIRLERAQRALAGTQMGYLCIGGKSLLDIGYTLSPLILYDSN